MKEDDEDDDDDNSSSDAVSSIGIGVNNIQNVDVVKKSPPMYHVLRRPAKPQK